MIALRRLAAWQSPREVEEALDRVFVRSEFTPPGGSPLWELVRRGLRAVADFVRELFPSINLGEGPRTLVFWLVVLVLIGVAARLAMRVRPWRPGWLGRRPAATKGQGTLAAPAPLNADEWNARAADLAGEGRWRDAAFALYHAVLWRLAARGAVRLDPAKTPGDYRLESRRDGESHRFLNRFLSGFEPLAFGARAADAASYQRLTELARPGADHD